MHYIQRKILGKLRYAIALTHDEMRPEAVEASHFAYHLQQLIRVGLIGESEQLYSLTPLGLASIDRLVQEKTTDGRQLPITTAIDLTNDAGHTLLFVRTFQPYIYRLGFPLGKAHFNEDIATSAARELQEKSGLQGIPLTHKGIVYIEAKMQGQTISKILCHVFHGHVARALATTKSPRGECVWMDHRELDPGAAMPGFHSIKQLLAGGDALFFDELHEHVG
jgi:ADP-ribose pyrophosphatase YjhB (NUDIX family)